MSNLQQNAFELDENKTTQILEFINFLVFIAETFRGRGHLSTYYCKVSTQSIQGQNCIKTGCKIEILYTIVPSI